MNWLIFNHIHNAYQSLKATKLRSFLTMLGITIGVASVTFILSLSNGAMSVISKQVDHMDGNIALIRPGHKNPNQRLSQYISPTYQSYATSSLTEEDLDTVTSTKHVTATAPLMLLNGTVSVDKQKVHDQQIIATNGDLPKTTSLTLNDGQFIGDDTADDTAVIGLQSAIDLFGTPNAVSNLFTVHGKQFRVVGVLKQQNKPVNYNNVDFDNVVIIKLSTAKSFSQGSEQIQQINFRATSKDDLTSVKKTVAQKIRHNHHDEKDFHIVTGKDIATPTSRLFNAIAIVTAAIAGVSLVVGGIGIMNIMLVSVSERTREVGIRKALGASNSQIIWQFLFESLGLSIGGGIFGYLIGYLAALAMSTVLPFFPSFSLTIALVALSLSVIVGGVFGLYPALRAAQKDPIESLRHYD